MSCIIMEHASVGVEGAKSFNKTYKSFFFRVLWIFHLLFYYTQILYITIYSAQMKNRSEKLYKHYLYPKNNIFNPALSIIKIVNCYTKQLPILLL